MKGKGVGGECAGKGGQISDDWLTDWFSTEHSTYLYSCNEMRTFTFVVSIFDNFFLSIKHVHTSNVLVVFQFADSVPQARLPSPSPLKHVYTSNECNVLVFQFEPLCTNRVTQACLPSPPPLRWREKRPGRKEVSQLKSVKRETYRIYRYNYNLSVAWMALVVLTARYQWAFVSLVLQVFRPVW